MTAEMGRGYSENAEEGQLFQLVKVRMVARDCGR